MPPFLQRLSDISAPYSSWRGEGATNAASLAKWRPIRRQKTVVGQKKPGVKPGFCWC
jgi:hypothetical protein